MVHVHNHHHIEIALYNSLADIQDINIVFRKIRTHSGYNSNRIMSYYRYNSFFHMLSSNFPYAISIKRETSLLFAT